VNGGVVTGFQYLYYLLESAMVVLLLAFLQRAGEKWTKSTRAHGEGSDWRCRGAQLIWAPILKGPL
jgi:hypothetical protein